MLPTAWYTDGLGVQTHDTGKLSRLWYVDAVRTLDRPSRDAAPTVVLDDGIVRLENDKLRAEIAPALSGKVVGLFEKAKGHEALWLPRADGGLTAGTRREAGGWSDVVEVGEPEGRSSSIRAHRRRGTGTVAMDVHAMRAEQTQASVTLSCLLPATAALWTRTFTLHPGEASLRLCTTIENAGTQPIEVAWRSRACVSLDPGVQLDVPARHGFVAEADPGGVLGTCGRHFDYPLQPRESRSQLDVRHVADVGCDAGHALHRLTGLFGGWLATTDASGRSRFVIRFDHNLFPCVHQWSFLGGRSGWHHAALAPSTAPDAPRVVAPGETLQTTMIAVVFDCASGTA